MKSAVLGTEKDPKGTVFNKDRILFAEDHPGLLRMISGFLRDHGYLVTAVNNGSQAYETLLVNNYDVIILDINMPVMGGVEAVKAIREQKPHSY
ncbi:MAG: response regulator [Fibrobacterota bacterium]